MSTKTEITTNIDYHPNINVAMPKILLKVMSLKLKCHQSRNVTKTEMSPKRKYYQNGNIPKTKICQKLKCH